MIDVVITRPVPSNLDELHVLFLETITFAFKQNGVNDTSEINHEVESQIKLVKDDFESSGSTEYFLIAKTSDKIIGTIASGRVSQIIRGNLDIDFTEIPEIKSVFVAPDYHSRGIGIKLWNAILLKLQENAISQACLDSGYIQAQKFWINRIGKPTVTLNNYWGKNKLHMIWLFDVNKISRHTHGPH